MNKVSTALLAAALAVSLAGCATDGGAVVELAAQKEAQQEASAQSATQVPSKEQTPTSSTPEPAPAPSPAPVVVGTYYTRQNLVDQQIGVDVFSAFVPQGWTASLASDWTVISAARPGLEAITILSPDGQAQVAISSRMDFVQHPYGEEGQSFEVYTTYLNYLDAAEFTDRYISNTYGTSATLVAEVPDDANTLAQLQQYLGATVEQGTQAAETLMGGAGAGGMTFSVAPYDATFCRRQYQVGGQRIETTAPDVAYTSTVSGSALTQEFINWSIPYSIVYSAASDAVFDQYYGDYQMIIANSFFTLNYYAAEEYISSMIAAVAMDAKAAAISDGQSFFSKSGYTSETGESTNEKIINMWDDVIKEVDSYTTLDGDIVKTSTQNDMVAQSGDEFFVGPSTSDIPPGFTELTKRY